MAKKKRSAKPVPETLTPVEELQRILQTGIAVSDLAKHLMRVNALVRDGISNGDIHVPNADFFRKLQSEMNRVSNLTIQVQDGVLAVKKPGILTKLWSIVSPKPGPKATITQAKQLMAEQQQALTQPSVQEVIYARNGLAETN
jgi:hypothetical protein